MTSGFPVIVAVVDNEASVRKALLRLLRAAGLEAHTFASASEFLEALSSQRYDCVVLDLHMPEMSGFDLQRDTTFVREAIPTIVITAHDEPGTGQKCMALGAAAYLRKPFDDKDLLSAIEDAVGRQAHAEGGQ
jgi:FixJ family two-component response regulator